MVEVVVKVMGIVRMVVVNVIGMVWVVVMGIVRMVVVNVIRMVWVVVMGKGKTKSLEMTASFGGSSCGDGEGEENTGDEDSSSGS